MSRPEAAVPAHYTRLDHTGSRQEPHPVLEFTFTGMLAAGFLALASLGGYAVYRLFKGRS